MPATADRRSGHEQRDVRASGDPGEPRDAARARRDRARAGHRFAGLAGGVRDRPPAGAAGAARRGRGRRCASAATSTGAGPGHRGRDARADRCRALRRQPLLRAHGVRAREEAKRRGANVTVVAANVSLPARSGHRVCRRGDRRRARRRLFRALRRVRRADHGRRRRRLPAGGRARRQAQEGPDRRGTEPARSSVLRTCCPRSPSAAAPASCSSASPPSTATGALAYGRDKLARKKLDAVDRE